MANRAQVIRVAGHLRVHCRTCGALQGSECKVTGIGPCAGLPLFVNGQMRVHKARASALRRHLQHPTQPISDEAPLGRPGRQAGLAQDDKLMIVNQDPGDSQ